MVDGPRPSPRPDVGAELEKEPVTGVMPASRDFVREVSRSGLFKVAVGVGSFAVVCLLAGVTVARAFAQEAHDAGVKAAEAHESRIKALEQQVPQLREEVYQGRLDIQALYKTVVEGRRQERLEHPPPPPTAKDGGP